MPVTAQQVQSAIRRVGEIDNDGEGEWYSALVCEVCRELGVKVADLRAVCDLPANGLHVSGVLIEWIDPQTTEIGAGV